MAAFDLELWNARAWDRFQKAIQAGKNADRATKRWTEDRHYVSALRVVVEWCEARSLTVTFCKRSGGIYYTADKEIKVSGRASPKHQLHILLHECGHHLIGSKDKYERYGMGYGNQDPDVKRSFHHRIDIVDEEFEAWHRGWKLARRLGALTKKDKAAFDRTRVAMLRTYLLWATKAPGYEKYDDPAEADDDATVA
jgi:hypothetical protein